MHINRMTIKHQQIILRGAFCEMCGKNPVHDLHEIFSRSLTVGNEEARYISYHPELCSLLCRECHKKADSDESKVFLLKKNIQTFGRVRVEEKYNALQAVMRNKIMFNFDEVVDAG